MDSLDSSIAHQDGYWTMGYHVTIGSQAAVECAGCLHWRGKTRGETPMVLCLKIGRFCSFPRENEYG
jgi:hypothetical protein